MDGATSRGLDLDLDERVIARGVEQDGDLLARPEGAGREERSKGGHCRHRLGRIDPGAGQQPAKGVAAPDEQDTLGRRCVLCSCGEGPSHHQQPQQTRRHGGHGPRPHHIPLALAPGVVNQVAATASTLGRGKLPRRPV